VAVPLRPLLHSCSALRFAHFARKFPVNERVAAGVSYRDMLKEVGGVGFFIIGFLMYFAIMQLAGKEVSMTTSPDRGCGGGSRGRHRYRLTRGTGCS